MAGYVLIELLESSDEDKYLIHTIPPQPVVIEEHDKNELETLHPLFGTMRRNKHIKMQNYIENIVVNYIDKNFIMTYFVVSLIFRATQVVLFISSRFFKRTHSILDCQDVKR
ncbi:hypothetical protein PUN28_004266 [Cardiocondyla obscurior]|uniref:Uncharacterized protein n=1 Tax=Cardiocondyla obscurior TaxID=286306 RepID=A0AAW2GG16_9HYME